MDGIFMEQSNQSTSGIQARSVNVNCCDFDVKVIIPNMHERYHFCNALISAIKPDYSSGSLMMDKVFNVFFLKTFSDFPFEGLKEEKSGEIDIQKANRVFDELKIFERLDVANYELGKIIRDMKENIMEMIAYAKPELILG